MKISISVYGAHLLVPEEGRTVAKIMRKAAGICFDGIDLGYYWGENKKAEFAEAKKIAAGEGIEIANYIVGNNFGNAAAESKKKLTEEIKKVKLGLEEAAYFGCKTMRVFGGGYGLEWDKYSGKIADALAACVETAEKYGVVMALEDHGALCKNSKEQLFYINKVNSPYLRATSDIGNFWFPGNELPEDGVSNMAEYTAMVHVKDYQIINNLQVAVPVGEGIIDFETCFRILADAGYKGWLTLEYECGIGNPVHGIATSLVNIRRFATGC